MPLRDRIPLPTENPAAGEEPVRVAVPLGEQRYTIQVGSGLLPRLGALHPGGEGARALLVSTITVAGLYGQVCLETLRAAGWAVVLVTIPDGEGAKTLAQAGELYEACVRQGLDRGGTLFALGGGVIGDLTGFVAATYMRGIRFVQIPTTLLAQVDASVGGKTAVDLPAGKNLVGAFHQPAAVVIDVDTLRTLPRRDVAAGLAEVVKHGAIADAPLFEQLSHGAERLLAGDPIWLRQIVARNCQIKAEVVAADPREQGRRAILNFGHTIGHALETAAGEWDLRHGEAVALGMIAEARLAEDLGRAEPGVAARIEAVVATCGLPLTAPPVARDRAREALRHDKKFARGRLKLPLVPRIGECEIHEDIPSQALLEALERAVTDR